jgi:hypothetical protein
VEVVVQIVAELLFEGLFEALGWTLGKRWGRLVLGSALGVAGGVGYSFLVGHDLPIVALLAVGAQAAAVPFLASREVLGRRLDRGVLIDLVVIGAAVVVGRTGAVIVAG